MHHPNASRLDHLAEAWKETEIARPSLGRWIDQFDADDQAIALRLLECMQMHGWARLIREYRLLHERLCPDLAEDGFDVEHCSDIDFTRAFVCKSGDLILHLYRKANRLPATCFHNIEGLQASPLEPDQRRALVILDEYIGTGSQFLFTFVARHATNRALLQRYARVRLAAIEEHQLTCVDFAPERQELITALASLDWRRAGLVAAERDVPVIAHPQLNPEEREQRRGFLRRQQEAEGAGTTEFLLGHRSLLRWSPLCPGAGAAAAVPADRGFQRLPVRVAGGPARRSARCRHRQARAGANSTPPQRRVQHAQLDLAPVALARCPQTRASPSTPSNACSRSASSLLVRVVRGPSPRRERSRARG